jgi:hypothetical protein
MKGGRRTRVSEVIDLRWVKSLVWEVLRVVLRFDEGLLEIG